MTDWTAGYGRDLSGGRPAMEPMGLGSLADFGDSVPAGFKAQRAGIGLSDTQRRYEAALARSMSQAVRDAGIALPAKPVRVLGRTLFEMPARMAIETLPEQGSSLRADAETRLFAAYNKARAANPKLPDVGTPAAFLAEVTRRRKSEASAAEAEIADSWAGVAGAFVGGVGAGFTDPLVLATAGIGPEFVAVRGLASTILRRAAAGAAIEAGVTLGMAPMLFADAEANDFDYGKDELLGDMALSSAAGLVLGGASGGLVVRQVRRAERLRAANDAGLVAAVRAAAAEEGRELTQEERGAAALLEEDEAVAASNPFVAGPEADTAHDAAMGEAGAAIVESRASGLPEASPLPVRADAAAVRVSGNVTPDSLAASLAGGPALQSGRIYGIDARLLRTDPATFQYKADGDAEGVTERLRGVTAWNADAAGTVMAWQRADGQIFVADGHQRSGLARRLMADGAEPIVLDAKLYREADGHSAEEVMLRAASANILNDSGTSVDAAKIMRRVGASSSYLSGLNMRSALARAAVGLSRLEDEAFGLVINGDDRTALAGGIVGQVAGDAAASAPGLHSQMIIALRDSNLTNASQMEMMARDMVAAPRVNETQTNMFGDLTVTRGLWAERARVLDLAVKMIGDARRALVSAADNAGTLEAAGSRVDKASASAVAEQNAALAVVVEKLARMTDNPVNDALTRAAARLPEGVKPDAAARTFVEELRARPDILGAGGGNDARASDGGAGGRDGRRDGGGNAGDEPQGGADSGGPESATEGNGAGDAFDPGAALGDIFGAAADDVTAVPAALRTAADALEGLDLGAMVDPAAAARNAERAQMGAEAPLRAGDRAGQDDLDGLALFDTARAPDMFGEARQGDAAAALTGSALRTFDDPAGAAAREQADLLLHDVRRDAEAGGAADGPLLVLDGREPMPLRTALAEIDGDEAALKALRDCL